MEAIMLVPSYEPEIVLPPCDFGRETVNVIGHVAADISPVFPYLNATQPGAMYHAAGPTLRFRFEGHMVTLQPHQMAIGGLADGDEAVEALARLQRLINDTWQRRDEIEPSTVERKRLNPLAVYKLLPRTNCRACGQPSCLVFANKLVVGQVALEQCTPLCREAQYQEALARLRAMLDLAPSVAQSGKD
ncbi:MAG TPA: Fe-S cluster protein [Anaerolineae bacterium]|nr:Fe-S cluster protein [Anaerolineae bacterium]